MLETTDPEHRVLQELLFNKAKLYQDDSHLPKMGKDVARPSERTTLRGCG
jgi:hypothetical protein